MMARPPSPSGSSANLVPRGVIAMMASARAHSPRKAVWFPARRKPASAIRQGGEESGKSYWSVGGAILIVREQHAHGSLAIKVVTEDVLTLGGHHLLR